MLETARFSSERAAGRSQNGPLRAWMPIGPVHASSGTNARNYRRIGVSYEGARARWHYWIRSQCDVRRALLNCKAVAEQR